MIHGMTMGLDHIAQADYLSAHKHVTQLELNKMRKSCLDFFVMYGATDINLVIAMIQEQNSEIKAVVIELLCVFQEIIIKKQINRSKTSSQDMSKETATLTSVPQVTETKSASLPLYFLFTLELYLSKTVSMGLILEGLSNVFSKSIVTPKNLKVIKKFLDQFIIPIFASSLDINYEFTAEFEKIILAIFDAGFCEYFLSKIDYIKEIFIYSLQSIAKSRRQAHNLIPKAKLYLMLLDRMLLKHGLMFVDIIPQVAKFYIEELL